MSAAQNETATGIGRWLPRLNMSANVQGSLVGLILLCVVFSFSSEYFLTVRNLLNVLDQVTVLGILAIGMTAVIVTGGIDLSVGSVLALSMMMMGYVYDYHSVPLPIAMVLAVLVGALAGLTSGLMITVARLPAFIATLAMMSIARGLANLPTDGRQVVGFPEWFQSFAITRYFGFLSMTVATFIILAVLAWVYMRYRPNGRNLYAIGGSREVARLAGVRVQRLTTMVYVVSGALAGVAAIAMASRLNSAQPSAGFTYELDTIAAVVIGGASLVGGVGSIGGTVVGVLIIGVLRNGLNLLDVSPFVQQVVIGCVIAIAVACDTLGRKHGSR